MQASAVFGDLRSQRRGSMKMERQEEEGDKNQDTDPTVQLQNVPSRSPLSVHGRSDNPGFWACQTGIAVALRHLQALNGILTPTAIGEFTLGVKMPKLFPKWDKLLAKRAQVVPL
jgi:hypothetical protein